MLFFGKGTTLLFVIAIFFSGCSSYKVKTIENEFRGTTFHVMDNNKVSGAGLGMKLELNAGVMESFEGGKQYFLKIECEVSTVGSSSGLNIPFGETLYLLVEGDRMSFSGEGSSSNRKRESSYNTFLQTSLGGQTETAYYPATRNQMESIARASSVKVRVDGRNSYLDGNLTAENLDRFKKFLEWY